MRSGFKTAQRYRNNAKKWTHKKRRRIIKKYTNDSANKEGHQSISVHTNINKPGNDWSCRFARIKHTKKELTLARKNARKEKMGFLQKL